MRAFLTVFVGIACALASASFDTTPSHAAKPSKADRRRAVRLFEQSAEAYRAGKFEEAAALLREAHALDPAPTLLYNLARALESAGDLEGAKEAYERYVEAEPDAKDRAAIDRRIENLGRTLRERRELEARLEEERKRKAEEEAQAKLRPPPAPPPPIATTATRPPEEEDAAVVPWLVTGIGAAVVGSGVVLGVLARSRHDDAVTAPVQLDAKTLSDEASGLAAAANVSYVAGGVVVAGGLVWALIAMSGTEPDAVVVAPMVGPAHAGVNVSF